MVLKDRIEESLSFSIESNCVTLYIYLYPVTRVFQNLQELFFAGSGPFLAQGAHVFPSRSFRQSTKVSVSAKKKKSKSRE